MELERRRSGLVVPKKPPAQPARKHGPLELKDEEQRSAAKEALSLLWDAMDLSRGGGIRLAEIPDHTSSYRLYRFVGEVLLGDECPEKEILT